MMIRSTNVHVPKKSTRTAWVLYTVLSVCVLVVLEIAIAEAIINKDIQFFKSGEVVYDKYGKQILAPDYWF